MGNRRDPKQSKTKMYRLALNQGVRSDDGPEDVAVADSNNMMALPGTGNTPWLVNRWGSERRKRYDVTTSPAGRKALILESAPPDVDTGSLFLIVNTANGGNVIEHGEIVRDRATLEGETTSGFAAFASESYVVSFEEPSVLLDLVRTGDLSERSIRVKTADGTATDAGNNYDAIDEIITFAQGATTASTTITIPFTTTLVDIYFFVDLYAVSDGLTPTAPSRMTITVEQRG